MYSAVAHGLTISLPYLAPFFLYSFKHTYFLNIDMYKMYLHAYQVGLILMLFTKLPIRTNETTIHLFVPFVMHRYLSYL